MRFLVTHSPSHQAGELIDKLEALGLHIDRDFPPIVVDPASDRFVLRGEGSSELLERARTELGVEVFPDESFGPTQHR
jgi:hypothetical protein